MDIFWALFLAGASERSIVSQNLPLGNESCQKCEIQDNILEKVQEGVCTNPWLRLRGVGETRQQTCARFTQKGWRGFGRARE